MLFSGHFYKWAMLLRATSSFTLGISLHKESQFKLHLPDMVKNQMFVCRIWGSPNFGHLHLERMQACRTVKVTCEFVSTKFRVRTGYKEY